MIKPDGMSGNYSNRIKDVILESGFGIVKESIVQLDEDTAASFYAEHSTRSFFSCLIKYITRYVLYIYFLDYCLLFFIFLKSELCSCVGP